MSTRQMSSVNAPKVLVTLIISKREHVYTQRTIGTAAQQGAGAEKLGCDSKQFKRDSRVETPRPWYLPPAWYEPVNTQPVRHEGSDRSAAVR